MWQKVCRDLNSKINNLPMLEVSIVSFHARWEKFYLPILRSFTEAGYPDHPLCLLAHGGSVNNKCFTKSIKKLSMNKSDRLIVYEFCVTLASSAQQCCSFVYSSVVFSAQRFLNMQKSLRGHKKSLTAVIEGNKIRLCIFMCIWTSNKHVKFHVKIPSGCSENDKQL